MMQTQTAEEIAAGLTEWQRQLLLGMEWYNYSDVKELLGQGLFTFHPLTEQDTFKGSFTKSPLGLAVVDVLVPPQPATVPQPADTELAGLREQVARLEDLVTSLTSELSITREALMDIRALTQNSKIEKIIDSALNPQVES